MANAYMRREYGKPTGSDGADKQISTGSLEMIQAGPPSGNTGPTGSSRRYAKGSSLSLSPDYNPYKVPASTYGVNGV